MGSEWGRRLNNDKEKKEEESTADYVSPSWVVLEEEARTTTRENMEDYFDFVTPATGGASRLAPTQLRLARMHERNESDFPVWHPNLGYTHTYVYAYECLYMCMGLRVCTYISMPMAVPMCFDISIYIYIYLYIYIYISSALSISISLSLSVYV